MPMRALASLAVVGVSILPAYLVAGAPVSEREVRRDVVFLRWEGGGRIPGLRLAAPPEAGRLFLREIVPPAAGTLRFRRWALRRAEGVLLPAPIPESLSGRRMQIRILRRAPSPADNPEKTL